MTTYTLKLVSGVNYNLYNGATLVSDSDLATLFGSAGSAYFVFDFDGGTPTNTTSLTIVDSNSQAVITNTGLSGIAENTNFNGDWSTSATAFDTFVKSPTAVLDEAQLSDLMGKVKSAGANGVKTLTTADYNYHYSGDADDGIAPWLLDSGIYKFGEIAYIYLNNLNKTQYSVGSIFIISNHDSYTDIICLAGGVSTRASYKRLFADHSVSSDYNLQLGIINNLTTSNSSVPLSAQQGKKLADSIGTLSNLTTTAKTNAVVAINEVNAKVITNAGAPTTSTAGTVGQLLEDTTNGKLYICTDATNPYVWTEVGAGGGGTIPTKTSDLTNDGSDGTSTYVEADDLATVATSGSYNDLLNQPTIPSVASLLDVFYPIGSYYETSDTTFDPNVTWGGTWVEDSAGRATVAQDSSTFSTVGGTGGAETVTIASSNLPTHTHTYDKTSGTSGSTALTANQLPKLSGQFAFGDGAARYQGGDVVDPNSVSGIVTTATKTHNTVSAAPETIASHTVDDIVKIGFGNNEGHTHSISTSSTASGDGGFANTAVNNLQPYVVVKRWHRTA